MRVLEKLQTKQKLAVKVVWGFWGSAPAYREPVTGELARESLVSWRTFPSSAQREYWAWSEDNWSREPAQDIVCCNATAGTGGHIAGDG